MGHYSLLKKHANESQLYLLQKPFSMHPVQAVHKIAPERFPEFLRNKAMPEMIKRFESCWVALTWTLEALAPDAKDMKPFLVKKYKTKGYSFWGKDDLKSIIDKLP